MIIKQGKDALYSKFINEYSKNKMELRFVLQWIGRMELEVEEGKTIEEIAKSTLCDTADTIEGVWCNINKLITYIKPVWIYGDELALWNKKKHEKTIKTVPTNNVIHLSKHARKRMHERCGFGKGAQDKMAKVAYEKGLKIEETTGVTRSYLAKILYNTEDSHLATVRLYGDKVYIYKDQHNGILLVTVMQVPHAYIPMISKERLA